MSVYNEPSDELMIEFRSRYYALEDAVEELRRQHQVPETVSLDPRRVALLGDGLDEFLHLMERVSDIPLISDTQSS